MITIIVCFALVITVIAPLLAFGFMSGFCLNPIIWPRVKPKLQHLKATSRKDKHIAKLEAEIKHLREEKAC